MGYFKTGQRIKRIKGSYKKGTVVGAARYGNELFVLWDGKKKAEFVPIADVMEINERGGSRNA